MKARVCKPKVTAKHQEMFLTMLPTITRIARQAFSDLDLEGKEEATAEVVAASYVMFVGLVERGKEALAYPSVLAMYGAKRVRIGRKAATKLNIRDVSSEYCQLAKGIAVERLDRFDRETQSWWQQVTTLLFGDSARYVCDSTPRRKCQKTCVN